MDKFLRKSCVFGAILLVFALIFAGCEMGVKEKNKDDKTGDFNSTLVITGQPRYDSYIEGGDFDADPIIISVTASIPGAEESDLKYQWYSNTKASKRGGTAISGATESSYTLTDTAAGTYYFYVVITHEVDGVVKAQKTSDPITVKIAATVDITPNNTVTVSLTKRNYIRGFGGMSTPWDNAPDDNVNDFETMFNPDKLGYNISRIMIPPDNTDIDEMMRAFVGNETRFSGDYFYTNNKLPVRNKDHSTYYDKVKIVNKYGGYVLASPWSPPAAWKTNDSTNAGGHLREANYGDFKDYLKRYCEIMYENGAPIYTVSLQNEWTFEAKGYEGCEYENTEHATWWNQAGNFLDGVKGWGGGKEIAKVQAMSGESHNEINRLNSVLVSTGTQSTPYGSTVRAYIDLLGRHIYGSGISPSDFLPNAQNHPTDPKEIWMSEHNVNSGGASTYPNDSTWNYVWPFMNEVDLTLRLNHENAFIWWTAKRFYSMIGDDTYGTVDGDILPRGHGLSHFAKFAKETGRVDVTVTASNANPNAFAGNNTGPKIMAFVTLNDEFYAKPVETRNRRWKGVGPDAVPANLTVNDIKAISLVMFTPTNNSGGGGTNMETVKIDLPAGFTIRSATAMRSNRDEQSKYEEVAVGTDKKSAYVDLNAGEIVSVMFKK